MKVLNIHRRKFDVPVEKLAEVMNTLSSDRDLVWPSESWPAIRLSEGLKKGSKGGHGPIKYFVEDFIQGKSIVFRFTQPKGFAGVHKFELREISEYQSELIHTIDMRTSGSGTLKWLLAIRWLHDALVEDALDKVDNHFSHGSKSTKWNPIVRFWRMIFDLKFARKLFFPRKTNVSLQR